MTRTLPSVRLALATVVVGASALVCIGASTLLSSAPAAGTTALPAGWELCVLQGVGAPATQANVSDLDEWQLEEGGSTNNSNAYNPFNTRRTTDVNNNPLPETMTSNGFPAFANWLAGCSATTATLYQPNMWSITSALRSGDVSPPQAFLATVDQSQWCAPSAGGTPCYETAILGVAGAIATAVLTGSSALAVFGNVQNDVHGYQLAVLTVSADQNALAARNQDLAAAIGVDQSTHSALEAASRKLERFAVDEYVNTGLYVSTSLPTGRPSSPFGPQDANGVVAHQYESIAAGDLVASDRAATDAYHAARDHLHDASNAVAAAMVKLSTDDATQTRSLAKLVSDVATMQTAGACTTIALTATPIGSTAPAPGSSPAATGSTTTTTTTTAPPPTTTTTTTLPAASGPSVVPTPTVPSTTTTTEPPTTTTTTTTTTVPPTTTTTTTAPAAPAGGAATTPAPPASADPAGFSALQGCMASLAPPAPAPAATPST